MRRGRGKTTARRRGLTARRLIHTENFQGRKTDTPRSSNDTLLLKHAQPVNTLSKSKPEFENVRLSACESLPKESIMSLKYNTQVSHSYPAKFALHAMQYSHDEILPIHALLTRVILHQLLYLTALFYRNSTR